MTTTPDRERTRIDWSDLSLHGHWDWSTWVFGVRADWRPWMRFLVVEIGPICFSIEVGEDVVDDEQ